MKKGKIPYRIELRDHSLFAFAGLWDEFEDHEDETVHTFKILTRESKENSLAADYLVPVILNPAQSKVWLNPLTNEVELLDLLSPSPQESFHSYTVSPLINSINNQDRRVIQPSQPVDQFGNYTLFD